MLREGSVFCISLDLGGTQKGGRGLHAVRINRQKHINFKLTLLMLVDMTLNMNQKSY